MQYMQGSWFHQAVKPDKLYRSQHIQMHPFNYNRDKLLILYIKEGNALQTARGGFSDDLAMT
jgi:hypothetical protein